MFPENKKQSRRRFIAWGVASAAVFSAVKFILPSRKKETVKMLTQDGKLVSVDSLEIKAHEKNGEELRETQGREGIPGRRWVMVTDLSHCRNARKCISACQEAHHARRPQPEGLRAACTGMQEVSGSSPLSSTPGQRPFSRSRERAFSF